MPSYRSTAWLNGQMQWHLKVSRTEQGTFKASTDSVPGVECERPEEHQAIVGLKEILREKAVKGEL